MAFLPGLGNLFRTGRHQRRRARADAEVEIAASKVERAAFEEKRKKEKERANKIKIRGLRSKRSSSFFGDNNSYGRETVG